ncbi:MAG: antitoxin [Acidobacteria bacterium]|nr:antitoxin [Acidobacteriota bacterium]
MKQLSLRGFDKELQRRLRKLAQQRGISLNKAALVLLRKGAGLDEKQEGADVVGDSLDHLIGRWSEKEEKEFLAKVEAFERIDEDLWS